MTQPQIADDAFVVLFVCTGNICRSPLAEQLFRHQTAELADLIVAESAGTRAVIGHPMTEQAAELSRGYGGDPSEHMASDLTRERVRRANLILVASRGHRADVVSAVPRASRKTFTLREFERLLHTYADLEPEASARSRSKDAAGLDELIAEVASMRGMSSLMPQAMDDDVVDPYRRSQKTYNEAGRFVLDSVTAASSAILSAVNPVVSEKCNESSQNANLGSGPASFPSISTGE